MSSWKCKDLHILREAKFRNTLFLQRFWKRLVLVVVTFGYRRYFSFKKTGKRKFYWRANRNKDVLTIKPLFQIDLEVHVGIYGFLRLVDWEMDAISVIVVSNIIIANFSFDEISCRAGLFDIHHLGCLLPRWETFTPLLLAAANFQSRKFKPGLSWSLDKQMWANQWIALGPSNIFI